MSSAALDAIRDPDPKKRGTAVRDAVTKAEDGELPELVTLLLELLGDEDPFVRYSALDALGRLAAFRGVALDARAAERIVRRAADTHEYVRAETAVAIALLPDEHQSQEARAVLLRLLEDASPAVRQEAAAALGDVKQKDAVERLASRLTDENEAVRFECAFALASLGDDRGLELLLAALDKPKKRLDAMEALRRLKSPRAAASLEKQAVKLLGAWADKLTAWATIYAIDRRPAAAAQVLARTKSWNREERTYALALIGTHGIREGAEVLAEVARAVNNPLRDTAVRALGELGEDGGRAVLEQIAVDPAEPEELRRDATNALAKLEEARSK